MGCIFLLVKNAVVRLFPPVTFCEFVLFTLMLRVIVRLGEPGKRAEMRKTTQKVNVTIKMEPFHKCLFYIMHFSNMLQLQLIMDPLAVLAVLG